jgi:hypothetical protein
MYKFKDDYYGEDYNGEDYYGEGEDYSVDVGDEEAVKENGVE